MRRTRLETLVLALAVIGCGGQSGGSAVPAPSPAGRHLSDVPLAACTLKGEVPVKAEAQALCGTLTVPEDPAKPSGRSIGLRVAVVPATSGQPATDPLFVLAGGPGDAATEFFAWLPDLYAGVHAERDIVLVDQRGTGASNRLELPAAPVTTGLSDTAAAAAMSTWAADSLGALDADPAAYTSSVAADDLDLVRAALGYDRIDLYGTSYGGTLAQYYVRQHGDHVRAVVLDGATPLDVPVFERMATSSQQALDLLFTRCAADSACHAAFPNLTAEWASLLAGLPITVTDPVTNQAAQIDAVDVADTIHNALLVGTTAAQIPLTIHLATQGKPVEAAQILGAPSRGGPTLLMADEILCSEPWASFDPAHVSLTGAGSYALARELADAGERAQMCSYLPKGNASTSEGSGLETQLPILWLVGDGDPQDPPANLEAVADQQPNSRVVVMPAQEHVVGHLGCMPNVIAQFLDAANARELDVSCVARGADPAPSFRLN